MFVVARLPASELGGAVEGGGGGSAAARCGALDDNAWELYRLHLEVTYTLAGLLRTLRLREGDAAHRRNGEERRTSAHCSAGAGWRFCFPFGFIVAASISAASASTTAAAACARRRVRQQPRCKSSRPPHASLRLLFVGERGRGWPAAVSTRPAAPASPAATYALRRRERLQHWWEWPRRLCSSHRRLHDGGERGR